MGKKLGAINNCYLSTNSNVDKLFPSTYITATSTISPIYKNTNKLLHAFLTIYQHDPERQSAQANRHRVRQGRTGQRHERQQDH